MIKKGQEVICIMAKRGITPGKRYMVIGEWGSGADKRVIVVNDFLEDEYYYEYRFKPAHIRCIFDA